MVSREEIYRIVEMDLEPEEVHIASTLLPTFRPVGRESGLMGVKMDTQESPHPTHMLSNKRKREDESPVVELDTVIVGCVHPRQADSWGYNYNVLIANHPKFGKDWPKTVELPDTKGLMPRTIPLPTCPKKIFDLATSLDRYSDLHVDLDPLGQSLFTISEEIEEVIHQADDNTQFDFPPEVGWYMTMQLSPNPSVETFQPMCLPDIFHHLSSTVRRLNATKQHKLVPTLDLLSFYKIHEEAALASLTACLPNAKYGSLARMLSGRKCKTTHHFRGLLAPEVVAQYGSFEDAINGQFRHCKTLQRNVANLLSCPRERYPDHVKACLRQDWTKKSIFGL